MQTHMEAKGIDEVERGLAVAAATAPAKAYGVVVHYGAVLQRKVQANAAGRPGPRRVTGQYARSIRRRSRPLVAGGYTDIGTDAPQGRRLEVGFARADSLGRRYHQPPYPHFGPALDGLADPFAESVAAAGLPL